MSTRRSRRRANTTIEYDFTEWDAEKPRGHRERSNSVDLLQELRRSHKVHAPTQAVMARFGDHYCNEDHVVTVPNTAPNPTFARSFRYGKEPNKHECHDWRRKGHDTVSRGMQCDLKPPQRSTIVQCAPATREMNVQTHKWYPETVVVKKSSRDKGIQATTYEGANYEELIALIKSMNVKPVIKSGSGVPDGLMDHIVGALAELRAILEALKRTTDVVHVKEDEIISAVKNIRVTGGGGEGIPGGLVETIEQTLTIVRRLATTDDIGNMKGLLAELSNAIGLLKEDHGQILTILANLPKSSFGEEHYMRIIAFLQEIVTYLRIEEVEVKITRRQLYDGRCRCAEIGEAARAIYRSTDALLPALCQRCTNDLKGRTFVQSLGLPMSLTADIVNTLGKAIECIERDDDFNLELLMKECRQEISSKWDQKTYQVTYEALFHLSLLWQSGKTSVVLAGLVNVHVMVQSMKDEQHRYKLPDYIQDAIDGKNLTVLEKLFGAMNDQERLMVINSPMVKPTGRTLPLFVAAREGDVDIFTFLVTNGASLDARESDRSILHELAWISHGKRESPKLKDWNKVLVSMLGVVCDRAGHWWERQLLHAAWSGCTEASRTNALNYLFSVQDSKGLNALQFAARYASPEIIRKIVANPPYEFTPDPIVFGHDNGLKGFVVDQIESRLARKNHSILERMLLRDPLDGAKVMAIEPFKSMIEDKWNRYRIFYGIWFVCYICYMIVYSAVAVDRPIGKPSIAEMYRTNTDYGRMVGEIFILVCLPMFFYGEIRDGIRMGFVVPRPWLRTGMFRILTLCFVICTIVAVVLRFTLSPGESIALGLGVLLGWMLALEFLGAWQSIGMFATILHRVVYNDVALKFFLVWFFMIAGTSTATYVAYQESLEQSLLQETFPNASFWYAPLSLVKVSFALLDGDYATRAANPPFGVFLFIAFVFLFNFLLFNLLIAMMADTYSRARAKINRSWIWVKANYALLMDRRLPNFMCISYIDNTQGGFSRLASTKLRYLTRLVKRRVKGGNVVEVREHVVLVATDDLPKPVSIKPKDLDNLTSDLLATPRD